jgi:4-amino-4-deoxy-L-arabinose transferase-like glycosyltransferase
MKPKDARYLFMIFVLALSVRILYVTLLYPIFVSKEWIVLDPDMWDYHRLALRLLVTHDYGNDLFRPPLYPHFLFANYLFFGHTFKGIRVIQAILDSMTCLMLALTGKNLCDRNVGMLTGLVAAFYPFFIINTAHIMTETLFLFLYTSFFLFLLSFLDTYQSKYSILSGLSLGLCLLCRTTPIVFLPFFTIWFLTVVPVSFPKRVKQLLLIIALMTLVILPWTLRNYLILGRLVPISTNGGINFWLGNSEYGENIYLKKLRAEGTDWSREFWKEIYKNPDRQESWYYRKGLEYIKDNPQKFLRLMANKALFFWRVVPTWQHDITRFILSFIVYGSLPILGIVGLLLYPSYKKTKAYLFYLLFISFTFAHMLTLSTFRYRISFVDPYLIVFASFLVTSVLSRLTPEKQEKIFKK